MRIRNGFTLVELTVIITVIAILTAIATFGFTQYLKDGRDSQRIGSATSISEALEKYYDEHGEYPSCAALTGSISTVSSTVLKGIDQSAITVPNSNPPENAIKCGQTLAVNSATDFIEYVGDGSADCTGSVSCLSYKLRYKSEGENTIKELDGRRTVAVSTSGSASLTAGSVTYTSGNLSWQPVANTLSYLIQRSSNASFTSPTPYSSPNGTLTRQFTDMAPGVTEYFRMKAVTSGGDTAWSNTVTLTPTALTAPTLSSTQDNPAQLTQSWGAVAGAQAYGLQRSSTTNFSSGIENSSQTALTKVYSDTPIGSERSYRVRATVTNSAGTVIGGPWSNVITYTSFVPAPSAAPSISAAMSGTNAVGTRGTVTCTQGAVPYYQMRESHKANSGNADSWGAYSAWATGTTTLTVAGLQGHEHKFQANSACVYAGSYSNNVASTTAATVRGINQPAIPTWPSGLSKAWKHGVPGNYMNYGTSCPVGTWVGTTWYRSYAWNGATPRDYYHTFGFNDWWNLGPAGGANVEYWAHYNCASSYATSPDSGDSYDVINVTF